MSSQAFESFMAHLCGGVCSVENCFARSFCVSADVTAAFDPMNLKNYSTDTAKMSIESGYTAPKYMAR